MTSETTFIKIGRVPQTTKFHKSGAKSPMRFTLDAEVRAVEEGHRAIWMKEDSNNLRGVFKVISDSHLAKYRVDALVLPTGHIWFKCECPSGTNRPHLPVCCKHGALVGRRLERVGFAVRIVDGWVQKGVDILDRNGQD